MKKTIFLPLLLALSIMTGCQSDSGNTVSAPSDANNNNTEASQTDDEPEDHGAQNGPSTIKIAGSTSVAPLMKELADAFEDKFPQITLEIQETGSSAGINATLEGAAHLGMSSRDLTEEEIAQGLSYTEIALDGIAVIIHPDNPIADLEAEDISGIFAGDITNWSTLSGNDAAINIISREAGSGTRGAFEELLGLDDITSDVMFESSTGAVKLSVSSDVNAIGYISLGSMDDTVKALNVDGAACSTENVKNKSYAIARPFLVCSKEAYTGTIEQFMDFVLSDEGQKIVLENNYIDIN